MRRMKKKIALLSVVVLLLLGIALFRFQRYSIPYLPGVKLGMNPGEIEAIMGEPERIDSPGYADILIAFYSGRTIEGHNATYSLMFHNYPNDPHLTEINLTVSGCPDKETAQQVQKQLLNAFMKKEFWHLTIETVASIRDEPLSAWYGSDLAYTSFRTDGTDVLVHVYSIPIKIGFQM